MYRGTLEVVLGTGGYGQPRCICVLYVGTYLPSAVRGHFVYFTLECQAAGVGQEGQSFVVGEHGVAEAVRAPLQSDESLRHMSV